MKRISLSFLALVSFLAFSFTLLEKAAVTYKVDPAQSTLKWVGKKVTGQHEGNIKISSGSLVLDGANIKSGTFDIDMNSITCTDLTDKTYNEKLIGHLKAEDFFGTAKHPKATFVITKAVSKGKDLYDITGNLTIKGVTKPLDFPATVKNEGNKVTVNANVLVDRTKYNIKYGSASFFDNLGDKAIDNDFSLEVNLVATK